ncbi:hypothetical protein Y032_0211g2210 [Ancylostoma ceylanicum]|uniref:Uncharacterized protein n=1 Tax=Ancylostoma ceylanicum TaxID=53326 RepID=A0A016SKD8_9BILA|nr:hypothetical protein Y032_0211g2210 [Ancylostoma ceylanicum]
MNDNAVTVTFQTHIDDCDCFNFGDPHVIICALGTDEKSNALYRIDTVRNKARIMFFRFSNVLQPQAPLCLGGIARVDVSRHPARISQRQCWLRSLRCHARTQNIVQKSKDFSMHGGDSAGKSGFWGSASSIL